MSRAVIVVRTANRPEILNRCIEAAVADCSVAREAFWVVLDDSSCDYLRTSRETVRFWKQFGLRIAHVDKTVEEAIADSLPGVALRSSFEHLAARPSSCPTEGGRNLALVAGLSLNPDVLFFVDDDMVHRHKENCFLHWCLNTERRGSFIAAPRTLGIDDIAYLPRVADTMDIDVWAQFVSGAGFSADAGTWYSAANPLWKRVKNASDGSATMTYERRVVSGQFVALCGKGVEWLPFPGEYNADMNWAFLQSTLHGTPVLKVRGVNVQHLPPRIGHARAEAIMSEIVGLAILDALLQMNPQGEQAMSALAARLPDALGMELRKQLFQFMKAERAIRLCARTCANDTSAHVTLSQIGNTLDDVAQRLKSIDSRRLAVEWLEDFATRREMLLSLLQSEAVQTRIRRMLFADYD